MHMRSRAVRRVCVSSWIRVALSAASGPVESVGALGCVVSGCGGQARIDECARLMSASEAAALMRCRSRDVARRVQCKGRDCSAMMAVPRRGREARTTIECESCGALQCWSCSESAPHPGMPCGLVSRWQSQGGTLLAPRVDESEDAILRLTKACPRCGVRVQKNEGCQHMTCRTRDGRAGCGYEWCWQCLGPYHTSSGCTATPSAGAVGSASFREAMRVEAAESRRAWLAAQRQIESLSAEARLVSSGAAAMSARRLESVWRASAAAQAVLWSWSAMRSMVGDAMSREAEQQVSRVRELVSRLMSLDESSASASASASREDDEASRSVRETREATALAELLMHASGRAASE